MKIKYSFKRKFEKVIYKCIFNILNKKIINNKNDILFIKNINLSNDLSSLKVEISIFNNDTNIINELNKIEKEIRNDLYKKYKIYKIKNIFFLNDKNF